MNTSEFNYYFKNRNLVKIVLVLKSYKLLASLDLSAIEKDYNEDKKILKLYRKAINY